MIPSRRGRARRRVMRGSKWLQRAALFALPVIMVTCVGACDRQAATKTAGGRDAGANVGPIPTFIIIEPAEVYVKNVDGATPNVVFTVSAPGFNAGEDVSAKS